MWVGKVRSGHRDDVRIAGGHRSGGHPEIGHASSDEDGGTTVQDALCGRRGLERIVLGNAMEEIVRCPECGAPIERSKKS